MEKFKRIYSEHEFSVFIGSICLLLLVIAWILLQLAMSATYPVYDGIERIFYRGLAKTEYGYQVINEDGERISWEYYPEVVVEDFTEEGARLVRYQDENGKYGFLDMVTGEIAIEAAFDDAYTMTGEFTAVQKDGKWGILQYDGYLCEEYVYDMLYPMGARDYTVGMLDGKPCIVGAWSTESISLDVYESAGVPNERDQIPVTDKDGKIGFVNREGIELVSPQYDWVDEQYRDGMLLVKVNNTTGRLLFDETKGVFYTVTDIQKTNEWEVETEDVIEETVELHTIKKAVADRFEEVTPVAAYRI